jgi:hypothetical protein
MIPRKLLIPWIVTLIAATLLTAGVSWLGLIAEFHDAKWIVDSHPPLPYPTLLLRCIYPYIWMLPLIAMVVGIALLRRKEVSIVRFSWFVCSVSFALFCWFMLIVVSFFLVYCQRGHYISPISN